MQIVSLLALLAFAVAGVIQGLRVRRTSFLAGTYLPVHASDRQTGGWIEWFLMRHPALCSVLDGISDLLPGPDSDVSNAVSTSTTFTRLQSRTLLHRYYRWQIHSLLRVLCSLLFCGVLIALLSVGLTSGTHKIVSFGSMALCIYALHSWFRIRVEENATRKVCVSQAQDEGDMMLDAFGEISKSASRQAIAFALVFALNLCLQVAVYMDVDNQLALSTSNRPFEQVELPWIMELSELRT